MSAPEIQTLINFYARAGLHRHIQAVCNDALKKRGDDPVLLFWRAFGLIFEGQYSEAIRELNAIQNKRDLKLAVDAALIVAHERCKLVDREAVEELTASLTVSEQGTNEKGFLLASTFYWHMGMLDKARDMVQRVLDTQPNYLPAQSLRGWIDLSSEREPLVNKSIQYFENVLKNGSKKDIEALLGKAKFLEIKKQFGQALDHINHVVVLYPWFTPALTEKARVLIMSADWEQAVEVAQRVVTQDSYNIEAIKLLVLAHLAREGRHVVAANRIGDLLQAIDRYEPKNAEVYYHAARPFSRLACRNQAVLHQCIALLERAKSLNPENSEYITEFGYYQELLGNYGAALMHYKNGLRLNESNIPALYGMIKCQLLEDNFEEAEQQLEFLSEIQATTGRTAELAYLMGLLAWRQRQDKEEEIERLTEAVDIHFRNLKGLALGAEYFVKFNPDFLLEIAKEYLQHCGTDPIDTGDSSQEITTAQKLLEIITRAVPGQLECLYLLARTKYLRGDDEAAMRTLEQCLKLSPSFSEAHILMAQLLLRRDRDSSKAANASLEQALSHNFEVRELPLFHLLKAKIFEKSQDLDEALKVLDTALNLPGVRTAAKPDVRNRSRGKGQVSIFDRASIFLQKAVVLTKKGASEEADKILAETVAEFKGTSEEMRVALTTADLAIKNGDVERALALLSSASPSKPYYVQAMTTMANIYISHKNDRRQYIMCYRKIYDNIPTNHSMLLLGDAYMNIQEPEKAIKIYEEALAQNPSDSALASKIGKALITTHDYNKAIAYYEAALKAADPSKSVLRHDLAELYAKLRKYDQAERVLMEVLDKQKEYTDLSTMIGDVKFHLLRAKVAEGSSANTPRAIDALMKARELQISILSKIKGEQPEFVRTQREIAAQICYQLAEHQQSAKNIEKAQSFYNEALRHDDTHEKSILALAKLYLARGELDPCQHQCITLLRMDPANEDASIMLADLMFRKNEYEAATFHFQQLLERKPNHYSALYRLVMLLRRAGKLSEVPRFLRMAENLSTRSSMEPGLYYCKGSYNRYTNNPRDALNAFYMARKDPEWGQRALVNMIELYINIDGEMLSEPSADDAADKSAAVQSLGSAKELLRELPKDPRNLKYKVLECYLMIQSKNKATIESALSVLVEVLNQDRNYVPALLAVAYAYIVLKQTPKARNQLKRIAKMHYSSDDADDFERSWLLLADIYIQGGKFDLAQELLKRALSYNKSCARAWELMGFIMEKEQSYKDASDHYEAAWKMENESNPAIGYKLAFNYLKAKRNVEAIDVAHKVLVLYPNYPKIRKEVLDRARASLRP